MFSFLSCNLYFVVLFLCVIIYILFSFFILLSFIFCCHFPFVFIYILLFQFVEVADAMRQQKVGYPKYKSTGLIASHHLPHAMSNPVCIQQHLSYWLLNFYTVHWYPSELSSARKICWSLSLEIVSWPLLRLLLPFNCGTAIPKFHLLL